jgi:gas vesicle protein
MSQSAYKLELSRFALFWETHSQPDIEQQSKGGSQGGLLKNQCDVQDATISSSNSGSTFAYLVTGLGIGAAMSILLAPKSGAETRQWIANKCLDGLDTANKSIRHTRRQVKDMMDQGQEKISEAIEASREAIGKP